VQIGRFFVEQFDRGFVGARAVFPDEVVEVLAGACRCHEVRAARKVFQIEELVFDGGVDTFDIGVEVGARRRIEAVARAGWLSGRREWSARVWSPARRRLLDFVVAAARMSQQIF
jgi:hypothetical protein